MIIKRIIGVIIIIGGIAMILISNYIKKEVREGRIEISSAQQKVDSGKTLFSLNPITKEIGRGVTDSAQRKIDTGKRDVAYYEDLAKKLQYGGIAAIIVGVGVVFIGPRRKK